MAAVEVKSLQPAQLATLRTLALIFMWLGPPACCHAYPDRPLMLVVPFLASGSPDIEGTPDEFRALIEKDRARWASLLKTIAAR